MPFGNEKLLFQTVKTFHFICKISKYYLAANILSGFDLQKRLTLPLHLFLKCVPKIWPKIAGSLHHHETLFSENICSLRKRTWGLDFSGQHVKFCFPTQHQVHRHSTYHKTNSKNNTLCFPLLPTQIWFSVCLLKHSRHTNGTETHSN